MLQRHQRPQLKYGSGFRSSKQLTCFSRVSLLVLSILLACSSTQEYYGGQESYGGGEGYGAPPEEGPGQSFFVCPSRTEGYSCTCTEYEIDCTGVGLSTVPPNLESSIQRLILKDNAISSIDQLTSQNLPSLLYIDASYNSISSVDWSSFSSLTNLEELHLQMNVNLYFVDLSNLYSSKMRLLNVSGNNLLTILTGEFELQLEKLYIENCGLNFFNFGASISLCKIKVLHAGGNNFQMLPENALNCMSDLNEIKLNDCGLTALSSATFSQNPALSAIDLSNNELTNLPEGLFDGLSQLQEIKLNDCGLIALSRTTFSQNPALSSIDLSNNKLTEIPEGLLDELLQLQTLNLAGNPWSCDCSLMGLKIFLESFISSGGILVSEETTYCDSDAGPNSTITGVSAFDFSDCIGAVRLVRSSRWTNTVLTALNWTASCPLWQSSFVDIKCGLNKAASCVYDYSSGQYELAQYTRIVFGVEHKEECRDECAGDSNSYIGFDSSANGCICGDIVTVAGCTDCSLFLSNSSLCNDQFSNFKEVSSVMYDFYISVSPNPAVVMRETMFSISGGPSIYDTVSVNFGDASVTNSVLNVTRISHIFIYPGEFTVTFDLSNSTAPSLTARQVILKVVVTSGSGDGDLSCPPAVVSTFSELNIDAQFSSAWHQNVMWTRVGSRAGQASNAFDENCESGWTVFQGRCIQSVKTPSTMANSMSECSQLGARLLRLNSGADIETFMLNTTFFSSCSTTSYFIGAQWSSLAQQYQWESTGDQAFVFKETLLNADDGDCVAIDISGLKGMDCTTELPYVCEKDPIQCVSGQAGSDAVCYVLVSQALSREDAEQMCQSSYSNGHLVSVKDAAVNSRISQLITTTSWISLSSTTAEGHYMWLTGEFLSGYSNWASEPGTEPCVVMDSSGAWMTEPCHNQHNFVCQYFVGDEIKLPHQIAGVVPVLHDSSIVADVTEVTTPVSTVNTVTTIFPDAWISEQGHAVRWNFKTTVSSDDVPLALQIWRPTCTAGVLDRPGCNSNSPLFSCVTAQPSSCSSIACEEGYSFCFLSQSCLPLNQPCTCAGTTVANGIDCSSLTIDANSPSFELVHSWHVLVPAQNNVISFTPSSVLQLQPGDVIGVQAPGDIIICDNPSTSEWRHPVFSFISSDWLATSYVADYSSLSLNQDIKCMVNLVYATRTETLVPKTLNYLTSPGDYTYSLEVESASTTQTCSVKAVDKIEGLLWIFPEPGSAPVSSSTGDVINLVVDTNVPVPLVVKLLQGSDATVQWSVDNGNAVIVQFTNMCPSSLASLPESCQFSSSFLAAPYSSFQHSFVSGGKVTNITVTVSNDFNTEVLKASISAYEGITGVEFYHNNCTDHSSCEITVVKDVIEDFFVTVKSGEVVSVEYYLNGQILTPATTDLTLRHAFSKGTHLLKVVVSNPISTAQANITVHSQIKANFHGLIFDPIVDHAPVGEIQPLSATASVTYGAYYTATWTIANESYPYVTESAGSSTITPQVLVNIFQMTGNITVTLELEDAFGDHISTSMTVEVYKKIENVSITTPSSYVEASADTTFSISIDGSTSDTSEFYGRIQFAVDFGTSVETWISYKPFQEIQHTFSTVGVYDIKVTAYSYYHITQTHESIISVSAQRKISGLSLTYNGPKHVSEEIEFTANQNDGSDIMYSIDYGDGSAATALQSSPTFRYTYSVANVYEASISAQNGLGSKRATLVLYAYDEDLLQIIKVKAHHCVEMNKSVSISAEVAAETPGSLNYVWTMGNGQIESGIGLDQVTTVYSTIGLYTLSLFVENPIKNDKNDTHIKEVCVEEAITGLNVTYTTPVALQTPGDVVYVGFHASVLTGSNLTFKWSANGAYDLMSQDLLNLTVSSAGSHMVTLKLSNDLGQKSKRMELVAMEVVTGVEVRCNSCLSVVYTKTQSPCFFEAVLDHGSHETYEWSIDHIVMSYTGQSIQHTFTSAESYVIEVVTENEVSQNNASLSIIAQDEVLNVVLSGDHTYLKVNEQITFNVTYSSGTDAEILWTCDSMVVTGAVTDSLTRSFSSAGEHFCNVTVWNYVSSVSQTSTVFVLKKLADLAIEHTFTQDVNSNYYGALNTQYQFSAKANTLYLVNYEWEITDGSNVDTFTSRSPQYTFSSLGTSYTITLTARNKISNETVSLDVKIFEAITNLQIQNNATVKTHVYAGSAVKFEATFDTGTAVSYLWAVDGVTQSSTMEMLELVFSRLGTLTVTVEVSNTLGTVQASVDVGVHTAVSSVAVQTSPSLSSTYISSGTLLHLSSPSVTGTDLHYTWMVTRVGFVDIITSNLSSWDYTFIEAGHYKIDLNVSNPLSFDKDALEFEVQVPISDLTLTIQDPSVPTNGAVVFTAETNINATSVEFTWQVDGNMKQGSSFAMTFSRAGVYKVTATAENDVSSITREAEVKVLDPISNLQILDCGVVRQGAVPTSLMATIDSGTDVSYLWSIEVNSNNETVSGQNIIHTFANEDMYKIYLTAENEIETQTISCSLEVHLPIGSVTLNVSDPMPDYIFENQDVIFTVSGGNLQFATFIWTISQYPSNPKTSNSNSQVFTFSAVGNYTLTVDISNGVSQVQTSLDFTVKTFMCQRPVLGRVGDQTLTSQRSITMELEVSVDPKGCTEYLAVHTWEVFIASNCSVDLDSMTLVDLGSTATSSPTLVIKPRILDVGTYCVRFTTGYQYTIVSESMMYQVNIIPSPLRAVVRGGTRRTVAINTEFCIDGSLSYDPDESSTAVSALTYTWECQELTATGGCFQTASTHQYCYRAFNQGEYQVTLTVSSPGRISGTAQQIVDVLDTTDFVPVASIVCESCAALGNYRVSSSLHVALSATCDNCQCKPEFSWTVFEGQTQLTLGATDTLTGTDSENLVLRKWGALRDGVDYTFLVTVACSNASTTGSSGTASLTLEANSPPSSGQCVITPQEIIPLEDQVTVSCNNWFDTDDPDTLISYKIWVDVTDPTGSLQSYLLYTGTDSTQNVYLGSFSSESVDIRVMVSDEFGAMALGEKSTITFKTATISSDSTKTDYLATQTDTVLSGIIKQASPTSLLQYVIALGQQLNTESQLEEDSQTAGQGLTLEQIRAAIRDAITICLSTSVPISTLEDVQQMTYALRLITNYSSEYLTEDSQILMARTLHSMLEIIQQEATNGMDRSDIPTENFLMVILNLIDAVNAREYSSASLWDNGRTVSINDFSTDFTDLRPEIKSALSGLNFQGVSLEEAHRKAVTSSVMPLLEDVMVTTLKMMMANEEALVFTIDGVEIHGSRVHANDIALTDVSDTSQITLLSNVITNTNRVSDEVFELTASYHRNPYNYGYSEEEIYDMPVHTLSFYNENGSKIEVQSPSQDIVSLYLFTSGTAVAPVSISVGQLNESSQYNPLTGMTYSSVRLNAQQRKLVNVPDVLEGAMHIQMRLEDLPIATNPGFTSVTAYLGVNFQPSETDFDQSIILTSQLMDSGVDHRKYTFFIAGLMQTDSVQVLIINDDENYSVKFSMGVYVSACTFYNEINSQWSEEGCSAQEESISTVVSCKCNHLTSFSGVGIVSVTSIRFTDLWNINLKTNPVVFIAVSIIFAVYVATVILCRYLDKMDLRRISRIPLCGREGPFMYEVTILTGMGYNAGTSAHVGIKLYGDQAKGEARHLTKPGAFQRNCRDTFLIAHDSSLGNLTKILVWHDNTGLYPSWFLSHVEVRDHQTGLKYFFLVNSWLSLEMSDGVIQKTVKVADEEELKRSKLVFSNIFHRKLADFHTWLSISNRPDHSRFTRVQRATCCLTSFYLYMCINAMWYSLFKDKAEVAQSLSWNSFGWEDIIIALVSTVMVLPVLIALGMVFKKSRSEDSMFQEALRPSTAQTLEIEAMCDMSRDGGSCRTVTPLGDWNLAMDRESTTDSFAVPTGLKRTVPMHRGRRKGSSDSQVKVRPPVSSASGKRELWNEDNIMQSWPHKMPTWIREVKDEVKGAGPSLNIVPVARGLNTSGASRRSSRSVKTGPSGTRSYEDSDEDLQQKLDDADAEISRLEEKKRNRKISMEMKLKRGNTDDLFDSDDEWVNEGLDSFDTNSSMQKFNPREEPTLGPTTERRQSLRFGNLHNLESSGSKRDSLTYGRDGTRPSIVSSKSRSTLTSDNRGRTRSCSTTSQSVQARNRACVLPPWCIYMGYGICTILCCLSIILVLLYGYQFGSAIALKWLLSLLVSLFASVLVVEPLKVLVLALFVAVGTKDVRDEETDMIDLKPFIEANEQIKDVRFKPLGGFALLQAKVEGMKAQKLHKMLREVIVFLLMLGLFLAIIYVNYSCKTIFYTNNNIGNKFFNSLNNDENELNFSSIKTPTEFWTWSQSVLVHSLHLEDLDTAETFGYLLGPAWMRQIRSNIVSCPASSSLVMPPFPLSLDTGRCVEDAVHDPDTDLYSAGWTAPVANLVDWAYFSAGQLDGFSKFGQWLFYSGGGYKQELGQTYNDSLAILQGLESQNWTDLQTRAVFIEFTLYNPSADLTSYVTLMFEFPISGGVFTSSSIMSEKLLRLVSGVVDPLMVCQILFIPFVLYLLIVLLFNIKGSGFRFFACVWNWLDLLVFLLAGVNCGLYFACVIMATRQMDSFGDNQTLPAHLGHVVLLHMVLRYLQALLLFLFLLKVVKQARYAKPLYKFYSTLCIASGPLSGVGLVFSLLLLTHAHSGYLIFGSAIHGYRSFHNSLTSLVALICAHTNFEPMFQSERIFSHFFYLLAGVLIYGLTLALVIAVLTWSYKWSRSQMCYKTTLEEREYEMIEFMMKRFKLMLGLQKQKPSFRHVKFEGLPSLPSRGTSSNLSSRQSNSSRASSVSEAGRPDTSAQHMDTMMANLLPTWDHVLQTFQKVEDLDKQEEDVTKKLQDIVKGWHQNQRSTKNTRSKHKNLKPIMGKPPLDPKATFSRFRSRVGGRNPTIIAGRNSMTPPSTFAHDTTFGGRSWRPVSDQGMRSDPDFDKEDIPDLLTSIRERHSLGSASSLSLSISAMQRGSPGPGFYNDSRAGSARSTASGSKSFIKGNAVRPVDSKERSQKQAWDSSEV